MTEPVIFVPVREALAEMRDELRAMHREMHAMQLQLASSSATAVAGVADTAVGRARLALWTAAGSGPVASVLTYLLTRR